MRPPGSPVLIMVAVFLFCRSSIPVDVYVGFPLPSFSR